MTISQIYRHEILPGWFEDYPFLFSRVLILLPEVEFPNEFDAINDPFNGSVEFIQNSKLRKIIKKYPDHNIFRSWQLFNEDFEPVGYVPLIIDIDNSDLDISKAYKLTAKCLRYFEEASLFQKQNSLRIVFSGKKGFHIEARGEQKFDGDQIRSDLVSYLNINRKSVSCSNVFDEGIIDVFHEITRVTGSNNIWTDGKKYLKRQVAEISVDDFRKFSFSDLVN